MTAQIQPVPVAPTPAPVRPRRGSVWLGLGLGLLPMTLRWTIHLALNYGPLQYTEGPVVGLLRYGTIDPYLIFGVVLTVGGVLTVIPRTRRTGIGVLIASALQYLGWIALIKLLFRF